MNRARSICQGKSLSQKSATCAGFALAFPSALEQPDANSAGEVPFAAALVQLADDAGDCAVFGGGCFLQGMPKFWLKRERRTVTGDGEGAFVVLDHQSSRL